MTLSPPDGTRTFIRHALIGLALVVLALLLWRVAYALLLAFGGVLFAVFLTGAAGKARQWSGLGRGWSLALVGALLAAAIALPAAIIGPSIADQFGQLGDTLTQGAGEVRAYLDQRAWGRHLAAGVSQRMQEGGNFLGTAANLLMGAGDVLLALVVVFFAGIYFAVSPRLYTEGLIALVPQARQPRAREVSATLGNALWRWLLGQLVAMLIVGALTATGLFLAGVPLALALGLLTGLLEFVPFIGPLVAFIPILLVAFTAGSDVALYAGLVFLAVQQIESHLVTPLVQRRAVALPPVLVIVGAIALTLLFGILGAIFATPLLVVAMVCVKMLYMEDALGQRVEVPGSDATTDARAGAGARRKAHAADNPGCPARRRRGTPSATG